MSHPNPFYPRPVPSEIPHSSFIIVCLGRIWCCFSFWHPRRSLSGMRVWSQLGSVTAFTLGSWLSSRPTRVKRLGCFDHAQRQLGERCLYVFPDKVEPAKITCECPERNCVLGEGSVAKKVS